MDRSDYAGLGAAEARARLAAHGPNELPASHRRTWRDVLVDVLREPMFQLLVGASILYLVLGDVGEALLLLAFVNVSIGIAVVQQGRSERMIERLRVLSSPRARVIRDGRSQSVPGREVVPGDIVLVAEGERVPADAVLLDASDLLVDESLLTGESVPVEKCAGPVTGAVAPGGEGSPMVWSGTLVVRGRGVAQVTATGPGTAVGRIGRSLAQIDVAPTLLQAQTRRLVRLFALGGFALSALAIGLSLATGAGWLASLLAGIALAMALLPEEFPLVLTVFNVFGAWRLARQQVLVRRPGTIETLGAATVLCTDKTGTLTQNRMAVVQLVAADDRWSGAGAVSPPALAVLRWAALACEPQPSDPMDVAILALAAADPRARPTAAAPLHRYGLTRELLAVGNVHADPAGGPALVAAKGAPEAVAGLCGLQDAERSRILEEAAAMAAAGMRVLGVARTGSGGAPWPGSLRALSLEWVGLVGLADPLRKSVPQAVEQCRSAGIRVVMITGDHPATARAIARQAGIAADARVLTGSDLEQMAPAALAEAVRTTPVFARIAPQQKLAIVQALRSQGEVVAMTGDGVNDAPSLRAADIGVAMGGRGTDVAREAAAIVLADDDFGRIVQAVRLGRRIYDNLLKAVGFILAVHVPIAGLSLLPLLVGLPPLLGPMHIAFLELLIDPVCAVVFEAEAEEPGSMTRRPRPAAAHLFSRSLVALSVLQGLVVLATVLGILVLGRLLGLDEGQGRALAFTSLVAGNIALTLASRSIRTPLARVLRSRNPAFWWVVGIASALLSLVLGIPVLRSLFAFGVLEPAHLLMACGAGVAALAVLLLLRRPARDNGMPMRGALGGSAPGR